MPEDGEIVITKWAPDTCGCVLNYQWIRGSHEDTRVHVFHSFDKVCHDHENIMGAHRDSGKIVHGMHQDINSNGLHVYNAVLEENQRKNIMLQHAINTYPEKLGRRKQDRFGNTFNAPHEDLSYNFYFTGEAPKRVLNCSFFIKLEEHEMRTIENKFPGLVKVF